MNPKVDEFIRKANAWGSEMEQLRHLALECGLGEELKWKQPCYTYKNKNLLIISAFKDHCVLSFLKGVLLNDAEGLLVKPGENSQSVRFFKFTSAKEIDKKAATIKAYIYEAIEVEKAGLKVDLKESTNLTYSKELQDTLDKNPQFKAAFEALTPGRQRGYNMHFSAAKQSATRITRIESYTERILNGKGIHDCVCGHSKRMPNCDGSHKYL